ncbi:MAG: hypothetical protein JF615_14485 [Asticcacaulis sp.]|nr:hypothetical protein [Asticcacaulis sp.]
MSGGGNDTANTLIGNGGNNILSGRGGNDSLTGGLGADQFVFGTNSGSDTVTDFSATQNDRFNVHALAHGAVGGGGITLSQVGGDVLIDLGGGNTVTVLNALQSDVLSHMVW